jgi:hypothetical protein
MGGATSEIWVTPARLERTLRMLKPSKSTVDDTPNLAGEDVDPLKRQGGHDSSKGEPATGEGNSPKVEAQGRYRYETRPERLRAE